MPFTSQKRCFVLVHWWTRNLQLTFKNQMFRGRRHLSDPDRVDPCNHVEQRMDENRLQPGDSIIAPQKQLSHTPFVILSWPTLYWAERKPEDHGKTWRKGRTFELQKEANRCAADHPAMNKTAQITIFFFKWYFWNADLC